MITSTQNRVTKGKVLAIAVLLAALLASLMLAAKPSHATTTFTVNSTADYADATPAVPSCDTGNTVPGAGGEPEVECTLRAAIQQANYTSGADTINFAIPGSDVKTIAPATALPTITEAVTINGYTQPGAQPNAKAVGSDAILKVELSGASTQGADGLEFGAANSTVKGLVVNSWSQGIRIDGSGATGIKIVGNYIGTDASGTQDLGNSVGIRVYEGSNNTIGGATPAARNVISGNGNGIGIGDGGDAANGNKVSGNYIGTDATGTKDLGNAYDGVGIEATAGIDNASNNTIGGMTAAERNVISGNDQNGIGIYAIGNKAMGNYVGTDASGTKGIGNSENGVYINGANNVVGGTTAGERNILSANAQGVRIHGVAARGNKVTGNYVGTDRTGAASLGNGDGVRIEEAPANTIGGTTAAARNVISGNDSEGVVILGKGAAGNKVVGNYVGTGASGQRVPGHDDSGVTIVGATNSVVGGTEAGTGNIISGSGVGVAIAGDGATGNRLLSNSIFANFGLGIDLGADGPTANDPGDTDTGANNLQNKPVLSSAKKGATGTTTVRGNLNSTTGKTFAVQFFSNPSGTDEGKTLLGSKSVTTNGTGNVSFVFSTKKQVRLGQNITATATGAYGTSEFSAPRKVVSQ